MERIRRIARGLQTLAREVDLRDVFVFGGLASTVYGVSGFSVPAAWIVAGVVVFALGMARK
jgi:hypothetical protein